MAITPNKISSQQAISKQSYVTRIIDLYMCDDRSGHWNKKILVYNLLVSLLDYYPIMNIKTLGAEKL